MGMVRLAGRTAALQQHVHDGPGEDERCLTCWFHDTASSAAQEMRTAGGRAGRSNSRPTILFGALLTVGRLNSTCITHHPLPISSVSVCFEQNAPRRRWLTRRPHYLFSWWMQQQQSRRVRPRCSATHRPAQARLRCEWLRQERWWELPRRVQHSSGAQGVAGLWATAFVGRRHRGTLPTFELARQH